MRLRLPDIDDGQPIQMVWFDFDRSRFNHRSPPGRLGGVFRSWRPAPERLTVAPVAARLSTGSDVLPVASADGGLLVGELWLTYGIFHDFRTSFAPLDQFQQRKNDIYRQRL